MSRKTIILFIVILSVVSGVRLSSNLFDQYPWQGQYPQSCPDSLLFSRLLEQSIIQGEVIDSDSYICFPYEIKNVFAPFYLNFLVYSCWMIFSLLPGLSIDPVVVIGWFPILFYLAATLLIFLGINLTSNDKRFDCLLLLFLLPGLHSTLTAQYMLLDYDYLINFFIWSFLVFAMLFSNNERPLFKLLGSCACFLFILTWLGSPLFFLLVTAYGFFSWMIRRGCYLSFINYSGNSMLVGGACTLFLIFGSDYSNNGFSSVSFSFFQPLSVMFGGIFLLLLKFFENWKKSRNIGLAIVFVSSILIVFLFFGSFAQIKGFLFKSDPLMATIAELRSLVPFSSLVISLSPFGEVFKYLSWTIFAFPLVWFLPMKKIFKPQILILLDWAMIMICFSVYQVRYLRWLGPGAGLISAAVIFYFWTQASEQLQNCRYKNFKMAVKFLPIILLIYIGGYSGLILSRGLSDDEVEAFNWIRMKTPKTSGYADKKRPEYGFLSYWDEGNKIAYYGQRPVAVGNAILGFKSKAHVFASRDEDEAFEQCEKLGLRFIYITMRSNHESAYSLWEHLRNHAPGPEYKLVNEKIPEKVEHSGWFYHFLSENLSLKPLGDFSVATRFRLVYASKSRDENVPKIIIFERVKGAVINLNADPGSEVSCSIELDISGKQILYKRSDKISASGIYNLVLPYATSHKGGRITSSDFYKLMICKNGKPIKYKVFVENGDVLEGLKLKSEQLVELND